MGQTSMCRPSPPQTRTMFIFRMALFSCVLCLSLVCIHGAIEIALFRHRVSAEWPEVEGRAVAREYYSAGKGSRSYLIGLRFRTVEGKLVTSR